MKKFLALSLHLLISSFLFAQTLPSYLPSNGLVAWFPFNGNANDESGNGNNGTVNGATLTADRNGISNSAYSFSNNTISINHNSMFGFSQTTQFSLSIWFNLSGTQSVQHLIGKRPGGSQQFNWQLAFNYPANQGLTFSGNSN
jgi:hypothetical protein